MKYPLNYMEFIINKMSQQMGDEYIDEEIKTMFKVSKRLQVAFHDVKSLTYRYLLKVKSLKRKKAIQLGEIEEKDRKQELQKKKKERSEQKKKRDQQKKDSKEKPPQQKKRAQSEKKPSVSIHNSVSKKSQTKKPQQPLSPYFLFLNDKKKQIKATSPNMPLEQISKIMRSIWDKLSDEEKRPYALEYEKSRMQYDKEMQSFYRHLNNGKDGKSKGKNSSYGGSQKDAFDFLEEFDFQN